MATRERLILSSGACFFSRTTLCNKREPARCFNGLPLTPGSGASPARRGRRTIHDQLRCHRRLRTTYLCSFPAVETTVLVFDFQEARILSREHGGSHLISSHLVSPHLTSLDVTNHQTQLVQDVLDPSTAALSFGFVFRESNHRRTTSVVSVEPYCTNSQRRVGGKRERRTQKKTHPPVSHLCGTNSSLEREKETARLPTKSARKMQARVGGWRESLGKSISPSLQLREKDPAETVLRRWRLPIVYGTTRLLGTKNTKLSSEPITVRICDSRSL